MPRRTARRGRKPKACSRLEPSALAISRRAGGSSTKNPSPPLGLHSRTPLRAFRMPRSHAYDSSMLSSCSQLSRVTPLAARSLASCLSELRHQFRPLSLYYYFIHKNRGVWLPMPSQATSCLAHGLSLRLSPSASLRHRLSVGFGRVSPPFHSGGTLPRPLPLPRTAPAPPSFAATQNLMQTAVLISSMSKPLTLIIIILLTIGFIVAVVGVSGGFLLNS